MKKAKDRSPANRSARRQAVKVSNGAGSRPPVATGAPHSAEGAATGAGVSVDAQTRILRLATRLEELAKAKSSNFVSAEQALEDLVQAEEVFQDSRAWVGLYGPGESKLARGGITLDLFQFLAPENGKALASPSLRAWLDKQRQRALEDANWLYTDQGTKFRAVLSCLTPPLPRRQERKRRNPPPTKEGVRRDKDLVRAYREVKDFIGYLASKLQAKLAENGKTSADLKIGDFELQRLGGDIPEYVKSDFLRAVPLGSGRRPAAAALMGAVKRVLAGNQSESFVAMATADYLYESEMWPREANEQLFPRAANEKKTARGVKWIKGIREREKARRKAGRRSRGTS